MKLLLPAALVNWFRNPPPVIDAISLPDRPEWERELNLRHGLSEIQRGTQDNLLHFRRRQLEACCESSPTRKVVTR